MMITKLSPDEIFVFGSNLAGIHGAGAARQAYTQFGAAMGCGEGLTGQSYAFPTLDHLLRQLPLSTLMVARDNLYCACRDNPGTRFLLTKVGCGLAGFPEVVMRDLFTDPPTNLILPEGWL
jgi:hypothetical protein